MLDPAEVLDEIPEPDYENLITEDGKPVESVFQERQMRLLVDILYASWRPGRPFVALADVGIFGGETEKAVAPDVLVSLDVQIPKGKPMAKKNRSYFIWRYGKPPDVVVEVVSNREGGEEGKMPHYAALGIGYVVLYDPETYLSPRPLRAFELHGRHYVDLIPGWLPDVGLGLTIVDGDYEGMQALWLRWCDREGNVLPSSGEALDAAHQQIEAAHQMAEVERQRAETEHQRAEKLAERLRSLGIDDM